MLKLCPAIATMLEFLSAQKTQKFVEDWTIQGIFKHNFLLNGSTDSEK
jgi:hypothetical protein